MWLGRLDKAEEIDYLGGMSNPVTNVVEYKYDQTTGLVVQEKQTNSDNNTKIINTTYAHEISQYSTGMSGKNMLSQIASKETYIDTTLYNNARECQVNTWIEPVTGRWFQNKSYAWLEKQASYSLQNFDYTNWSANVVSAEPTSSDEWTRVSKVDSWDDHGNITQQRDANGIYTSIKWGYESALPVAAIQNAKYKESSFNGFENNELLDNWTKDNSSNISNLEAKTGTYSLLAAAHSWAVSNNWYAENTGHDNEIELNKTYVASVWVYLTNSADIGENIFEMKEVNGGVIVRNDVGVATKANEWELITLECYLGNSSNYLAVWASAYYADYPIYFDDIRFYPKDALMTSYSYDRGTFQLLSKADENNVITSYDYDDFGRLTGIRNSQNSLINQYTYILSRAQDANDTYNPANPNQIETQTFYNSQAINNYGKMIGYYDGLGKNFQNQLQEGNNDIITAIDYDLMDREEKVWKPYVADTDHTFTDKYDDPEDSDGVVESCQEYYDGNGPGMDCNGFPFIQTVYESNPLNRISQIGNPGSDFKITSGNEISYLYEKSGDDVEDYPLCQLYKNTILDENNQATATYTDKFNQTVLKRRYTNSGYSSYYYGYMEPLVINACNDPGGDDESTSENDSGVFTSDISCTAFCVVQIASTPESGDGTVTVKIGTGEGLQDVWNPQPYSISYNHNQTINFSFNATSGQPYYISVSVVANDYLDITCNVSVDFHNQSTVTATDTYFQYDILGNLEKIVPPKAEEAIPVRIVPPCSIIPLVNFLPK